VIEKINAQFHAVEINITDQGFPKEVPALKPWENAFTKDPRYEFGFTTSVVIGPGAKGAFGTSGCGHKEDHPTSPSYHPDRYLEFLDAALERYRRAVKIADDPALAERERADRLRSLQEEIAEAIKEGARCARAR
jgi:hypothetical protein